MLFIETEIFTEDVQKLLNDDEFSRFQFFLALNPDYGGLNFRYSTFCRNYGLLAWRVGAQASGQDG